MTIESNSSNQCSDNVMSSIMQAIGDGDEKALGVLNNTLADWPFDYRLWFLRGAIYASEGRHSEARSDFSRAIELSPEFHVATFMLGLLDLVSARTSEAAATWSTLDQLAEDDPLRVLKRGLLSLAHDQFDVALEELDRGLLLNQQYPLINSYIRSVIGQVTEHARQQQRAVLDAQPHQGHLLLSGYHGNQTRH
ncbi:tetratricopeptide (TPR) repeat protein [Paraburkholderia sp. EB58]|jgi:tetratricopeptide (TPR) repeat protein|uniref:tetratricopeptide repeat protein n=1 Tax=Paraburkholderia sp. EB58 TaxID=3035125 RepID=UPI003D19D6DA